MKFIALLQLEGDVISDSIKDLEDSLLMIKFCWSSVVLLIIKCLWSSVDSLNHKQVDYVGQKGQANNFIFKIIFKKCKNEKI